MVSKLVAPLLFAFLLASAFSSSSGPVSKASTSPTSRMDSVILKMALCGMYEPWFYSETRS